MLESANRMTSRYSLKEKSILHKWQSEKQICMKFHTPESSALLYERDFEARANILN
jgi:hypothetical protein